MSSCDHTEEVTSENSISETDKNEVVNDGDDAVNKESPKQEDAGNQTVPECATGAGIPGYEEDSPKRTQRRHFSHKTDSSIFETGDSNSADFTGDSSFRKHCDHTEEVTSENSISEADKNEEVKDDAAVKEESPSQEDTGNQTGAGIPGYEEDTPKCSQRRHFPHKTDSSIFESGDSNSADFSGDSSFRKQ